jgi:hypothetical protein
LKRDIIAAVMELDRTLDKNVSLHIDEAFEKGSNPVRAWTKIIGGTAHSNVHMCPCTVASQDLPEVVVMEVKQFFKMCKDTMASQGLFKAEASKPLSTLIGALVVSSAIGDNAENDCATRDLRRSGKPAIV